MNDRPLGCSVFYSTLLPYGFTSKLFTFSWAIEKCVSIFVDKIDIQLKNLVIIDFYRQIKLVDWKLSTNIKYYRLIDYVFDDRLWSTCNVLGKLVHVNATVNFTQIVKKAACLMAITQYKLFQLVSHLTLNEASFEKEIIWINSSTYQLTLEKNLWSNFRLGPKIRIQDRYNQESTSTITTDPRSTVFSKSTNPLDYRKNPQSMPLVRPNPLIRKPIHHLIIGKSYLTLILYNRETLSFDQLA